MFDRVPLRYLVPNAVTAGSIVLALAAIIHGLALMRALPVVLFAVALTYAAGGFVVGRLHAPHSTPPRGVTPHDPPHVA